MALSMHTSSAPVFVRMLSNSLTWLDKAQAFAEARKFSPDAYLNQRLSPDMLPFTRQVQIACDTVKGAMARLAGVDVPAWEDNEVTLDELRTRIRRTIDYVQSFKPEQIDGSEGREIALPTRSGEPRRFTGESYLKHFVTPNLYFHLTTVYALLRQGGVDIGKMDYLGR